MRTIALDVGGTAVSGGVFTDDLVSEFELARPSPAGGVASRIGVASAIVRELQARAPDAQAVGVAFAARVDVDRGLAQERAGAWVSVADRIGAELGVPVVVENDACAGLRAELACGAAGGATAAFLLSVGTDLGGAVAIGGRVHGGRSGLAGEVHDMLVPSGGGAVRWGDWVNGQRLGEEGAALAETGASGGLREAFEQGATIDGRLVTDLALAGDVEAVRLVGAFGTRLAIGLANVVRVLEPDRILVAGGLSRAGELLLAPLRAALLDDLPPGAEVTVDRAQLGERACLVGAAVLAMDAARPGVRLPSPLRA